MAAKSQDNQSKAGTGFAPGAESEAAGVGKANSIFGFGSKSADPKAAPKKNKKASRENQRKAKRKARAAADSAIPTVVSNRMLKRVLLFSGIPTLIAFGSIPASYALTTYGDIELPHAIVLATSLGSLAVGLLGISFGILSASWDEGLDGSLLGWREFQLNLGRIRDARRAHREQNNS